MKKTYSLQYLLVCLLCFFGAFSFLAQSAGADSITLTRGEDVVSDEKTAYIDEDLFDLMRPTLVRIVQRVEGTVVIPSFVIDSNTKTIAIDATKEPTVLENISENLLGTGFFISPDGYIVTNSHTVSLTASKLFIIDSFIQNAISEAVDGKNVDGVIDELFTEEIVDFMLEETSFDLVMSIVILNPAESLDEDGIFDFYDLGQVAQVLSVNDIFYKEGQDVALLQIPGTGYPSARLADDYDFILGEKVYLFKSPDVFVAENAYKLAGKELYDVSVVEGILTRKDATSGSVLYKLDITASAQFGGSMVFNSAGDVLGVALYDASSGLPSTESMFIVPVDLMTKLLLISEADAVESVFHKNIKEGLLLEKDLKCDDVKSSFAVALASETDFVDRNIFDKRVSLCNEKLGIEEKQNNSFSALLNIFQKELASMSILHWMVVVFIFFIIFFSVLWFVSRGGKNKDNKSEDASLRSEAIKTARRVPLSERMPISDTKEGRIDSGIKEPEKKISVDGIQKSDPSVVEGGNVDNEEEKSDDFHVVTAKFPRKNSLPKDIGDESRGAVGVLGAISEEDKEQLASLWPSKYKKNVSEKQKSNEDSALITYIKNTSKLGFGDNEIKTELAKTGWIQGDIENAFKNIK